MGSCTCINIPLFAVNEFGCLETWTCLALLSTAIMHPHDRISFSNILALKKVGTLNLSLEWCIKQLIIMCRHEQNASCSHLESIVHQAVYGNHDDKSHDASKAGMGKQDVAY